MNGLGLQIVIQSECILPTCSSRFGDSLRSVGSIRSFQMTETRFMHLQVL